MKLLVVEDDPTVAKGLFRVIAKLAPVEHAATLSAARELLDTHGDSIAGVISDLNLPDGMGFDVIRHARRTNPSMPALLLTGTFKSSVLDESFSLGVAYLTKPARPEAILIFVRRCLTENARLHGSMELLAVAWESRYRLTKTEVAVLEATARGVSREDFARARNMAESTLKKHVSNLLDKSGDLTLDRAALRFLRESMNGLTR